MYKLTVFLALSAIHLTHATIKEKNNQINEIPLSSIEQETVGDMGIKKSLKKAARKQKRQLLQDFARLSTKRIKKDNCYDELDDNMFQASDY